MELILWTRVARKKARVPALRREKQFLKKMVVPLWASSCQHHTGGVAIATGAVVDVASCINGSLAEGQETTVKSVGVDALGALIDGIGGEYDGQALRQQFKATKTLPVVPKGHNC
ncbi:hypothetical protein SS1G_10459 [Sclerotinia sclerotiorum 1980 UF-70]|uniref:Uncharacterized protein n=1 Tax=Sclerotinia sclerotiorum (strain ATCC 18683 / 1980 / Ss-1) TaxID=665079 RepID=A7EYP3_SCLS1|nr:hypothetical protein SS1G_10459 [Sclerotinia sclerotiorum 1980 UF-70]EDN94585.1 hypothetical protein SS1G_10459 [Sclerotinia sclerotiorum 1980 UF-70]